MSKRRVLAKLEAMRPKPDKVPAGWKTVAELMGITGKSDFWVLKRLRVGLEAGTVKQRLFRVLNRSGAVRRIPHYNLL